MHLLSLSEVRVLGRTILVPVTMAWATILMSRTDFCQTVSGQLRSLPSRSAPENQQKTCWRTTATTPDGALQCWRLTPIREMLLDRRVEALIVVEHKFIAAYRAWMTTAPRP